MTIIKSLSKQPLHYQIIAAIIGAIIIGSLTDQHTNVLGIHLIKVFEFIGTLFLNALKMVVVPLIVSAIINGIGTLGSSKDLGRIGIKTVSYYALSSFCAVTLGVIIVNLISPGTSSTGEPIGISAGLYSGTLLPNTGAHGITDIFKIFMDMLPPNIIEAAANGQMLGLITFSLLFGYYINHLKSDLQTSLSRLWKGIFEIMMNITMLIMKFAPLGILGLVAKAVMSVGLEMFVPILEFFICVLATLVLHVIGTLSVFLFVFARVNPFLHLKSMFPALLTAFSTSSSAATLPVTLECVEDNSGISNKITSLVLPLGSTINMDGTALYECVAALFIAQAYGIELSIATQFTVVLIAMLTSIGVAGIPSASLVAITLILGTIGLPPEGIGLLMLTDRILDMCRTAVNVYSDSCGAVVVARSEGEKTNIALKNSKIGYENN